MTFADEKYIAEDDPRPYIERDSITLEETLSVAGIPVYWEARLFGPLSTGEFVEMERHGATFADALANLETAIEGQGWRVA